MVREHRDRRITPGFRCLGHWREEGFFDCAHRRVFACSAETREAGTRRASLRMTAHGEWAKSRQVTAAARRNPSSSRHHARWFAWRQRLAGVLAGRIMKNAGQRPALRTAEWTRCRNGWATSRQVTAPGKPDPLGSTRRRPGGPVCRAPTKSANYGCGGFGGAAGGGGALGAGGAAGALSPGCAPSFAGGGFSGAGAAGCSEKLKPREAFASTVR